MIKVLIYPCLIIKYFKYLEFQDTLKLYTTLTRLLKFTVLLNQSHYLLSVTICVVCGIMKQ